MRVDYLGLEAFVAIADYGSFQRAADALNLSQAALSHRLKKIEEGLGNALLTRTPREVSLTPLGQGLLPEARRLLKELQDVYESVRQSAQRQAKRLAFACLPSVANSILPKLMAELRQERPELGYEVLDIPVTRIAEAVRNGAAEFGVTIVSAELSDLRLRPLFEEDYRLFLPKDHPLAARKSVRLEDLFDKPMARISSHSKNRQLLDVAFGEARDKLRWQFEVQNAIMAQRLVSSGAALTILPHSAISMAPVSLTCLPFEDVRLVRTIGIISRRGVPLSHTATEVLARIETELLAHFSTSEVVMPEPGSRPRD